MDREYHTDVVYAFRATGEYEKMRRALSLIYAQFDRRVRLATYDNINGDDNEGDWLYTIEEASSSSANGGWSPADYIFFRKSDRLFSASTRGELEATFLGNGYRDPHPETVEQAKLLRGVLDGVANVSDLGIAIVRYAQ